MGVCVKSGIDRTVVEGMKRSGARISYGATVKGFDAVDARFGVTSTGVGLGPASTGNVTPTYTKFDTTPRSHGSYRCGVDV